MAPLAESREVEQARGFWPAVVDVSRGENHLGSRDRMRLMVPSTAPFALVPGSHEAHEVRPQLPVGRVAGLILWLDRHLQAFSIAQSGYAAAMGTKSRCFAFGGFAFAGGGSLGVQTQDVTAS